MRLVIVKWRILQTCWFLVTSTGHNLYVVATTREAPLCTALGSQSKANQHADHITDNYISTCVCCVIGGVIPTTTIFIRSKYFPVDVMYLRYSRMENGADALCLVTGHLLGSSPSIALWRHDDRSQRRYLIPETVEL